MILALILGLILACGILERPSLLLAVAVVACFVRPASAEVITTGDGALLIDTSRPCEEREGAGMFYAELRIRGVTYPACFGVEDGAGVVLFRGHRFIAGPGLLKGGKNVEA